jgi:hypothetical protein
MAGKMAAKLLVVLERENGFEESSKLSWLDEDEVKQ